MAQNQLKTILTYVKDVLGVESFALSTSGALPPKAPGVRLKPYLFVSVYSGNQAAITEMQTRMVSALKLSVSDFDFINLEQTNVQPDAIYSADVIVIFGEAARKGMSFNDLKLGEVKANGSQKKIFTHSLTDLANSAPLKKETWTHLQSVF